MYNFHQTHMDQFYSTSKKPKKKNTFQNASLDRYVCLSRYHPTGRQYKWRQNRVEKKTQEKELSNKSLLSSINAQEWSDWLLKKDRRERYREKKTFFSSLLSSASHYDQNYLCQGNYDYFLLLLLNRVYSNRSSITNLSPLHKYIFSKWKKTFSFLFPIVFNNFSRQRRRRMPWLVYNMSLSNTVYLKTAYRYPIINDWMLKK